MAAVRDHDSRRVDPLGAPAGRVEGRRHHRGRRTLAAGHEGVARAVREVGQGGHGVGDLTVLAGLGVGRGEEAVARRARRDEGVREVAVAAQEGRRGRGGRLAVAGDGTAGAVEERVRHAGEGRHDDDERPAVGADERDRVTHGLGVRERRAPELPDLEPDTAPAAHPPISHRRTSCMASIP